MKNILILISVGLLIFSCGLRDPNKLIDEGYVSINTYKSNEIGWSITIPKGWVVVKQNNEEGMEAIEKTAGTKIDVSGLKQLISFKKDPFNLFNSSSEPFKEEYPGEFIENNRNLYKLIYDTYVNQGIKADTTSIKNTVVDGFEFSTFELKVYAKDGNLIMTQLLYSRLINGFQFGVNINYNNQKDRDIMLKAFMNSKFTKK